MTADPKKEREALDWLVDALVEDVISASEEDILAEAVEEGIDSVQVATDMRAIFERAVNEGGKAKLAAAKAAVRLATSQPETGYKANMQEARRRYEAMFGRADDLTLTMAARKGKGESERDIDSAIEDLAELGALEDEEDH